MKLTMIRRFLALESASGIVLLIATLLALILSNSGWSGWYQQITKPLLFWINEGLMTLFFLMVGLELKRGFLHGELSVRSQVLLPLVAAMGGMLLPALIYLAINYPDTIRLQGWAVPVATDIAFALSVLSLLGRRIPLGLKLFLMALAIFDDLGAILIIALFHAQPLSYLYLGVALGLVILLYGFNYLRVRNFFPYLFVSLLLWFCVWRSGIHVTVVGVVLAVILPFSPLREEKLHPWVAYGVMPLFAFANAGISFLGLSWHAWLDPVVLGVVAGLVLGKQLGVFGFSWLLIQLRLARLPKQTSWRQLYGVAMLCGIGFTMSLFLGTLAFGEGASYLISVKLGVLIGSLLAGTLGAIVLL